MLSRTLLNVALFLFVALLTGYIYFSSQQESADVTDTGLTQLAANQVSRIVIRHNQRRIELQKTGQTWRMQQPIDVPANTFRIDTLLNMLDTASQASYPAVDLDLDKYGLSASDTSITFNDQRIEFGIVNPINEYRYVRVGDTVHLVADHFYPLLSSQVGTLVARELISADAVIEKLVLPKDSLSRDDNNNWYSDSGLGPDAINETLYHWQNSQAFGVHNYMQRDSQTDISVYLAGVEEPVRFHVTDTDPWLIIARPDLDIEYHFNLEFHNRLLYPGTALDAAREINE